MVESSNKTRVLIVNKSVDTLAANLAAFKDCDFSCKSTYVGNPVKNNRFEAVVVCAKSKDELADMEDFLIRYENCPVVVFCGEKPATHPVFSKK
jgi:hypothetical protein